MSVEIEQGRSYVGGNKREETFIRRVELIDERHELHWRDYHLNTGASIGTGHCSIDHFRKNWAAREATEEEVRRCHKSPATLEHERRLYESYVRGCHMGLHDPEVITDEELEEELDRRRKQRAATTGGH